jgi:hypothetical protein
MELAWVSESEEKFAFSLQYNKFYAMTDELQRFHWHVPKQQPNQANADDS